MPSVIKFTKEHPKYGFLSNFTPTPIIIDGSRWPTVEHYYQAAKFFETIPYYSELVIRKADGPAEAKRLAKKAPCGIHPDWWDGLRDEYMLKALRAKFSPGSDMAKKLLATGDRNIVEYAPWGDAYWGDGGDGNGENRLGKMLVRVRQELVIARCAEVRTGQSGIWTPGDPLPDEMQEHAFVSWITDDIAVSPFAVATTSSALDDDDIEFIVSIGKFCPVGSSRPIAQVSGVDDGTYDVDDGDIRVILSMIKSFSSQGKTLVHCAAGVSRSPAFVALHLAVERDWSWKDAKAFVEKKREVTDIHPELERRLVDWLAEEYEG